MKIKTIQEKENDVIGRKEIKFELNYEKGTPSRGKILDKVSREYDSEEEKIVVRNMHNIPGLRKSEGKLYIYGSKDKLQKYESDYMKNRWKSPEEVESEGESEEESGEPEEESEEKDEEKEETEEDTEGEE